MLARDLDNETFRPDTNNCIVLTGTLHDPYTGTTIAFQRGQATSDDVQIDHVVALSNAWQTGAHQRAGAAGHARHSDCSGHVTVPADDQADASQDPTPAKDR